MSFTSFGIFLNAILQPSDTEQSKLAIKKIAEIDVELSRAYDQKLKNSDGCINILLTGSYEGLTKKLFNAIAEVIKESILEKSFKNKYQLTNPKYVSKDSSLIKAVHNKYSLTEGISEKVYNNIIIQLEYIQLLHS